MKCILNKRILPLLCVGLLLCTPHTTAYATVGDIESTITQTEEAEPSAEMPSSVEVAPSTEEAASQTEETAPPTEEAAPPTEEAIPPTEEAASPTEEAIPQTETILSEKPPTEENTENTSYSVEIAWESLKFDCAPLWNPDEHCYDEWESTENPITVTNKTQNGVPIRVTLTFVPMNGIGSTAVFAPCEDDPHPEDFTFSDGQVTFLLPRDTDSETQATVNLFLTGDPLSPETQQYNQIGSIKTEITPLHDGTKDLETVPPSVSDIRQPLISKLPLQESEPPVEEEPEKKHTEPSQPAPTEPGLSGPPAESEQLPPPKEEEQPPETETEEPEQESPPEQNSKEETQTAPHTESDASPQEEPQ